jgi:hypothetical protein
MSFIPGPPHSDPISFRLEPLLGVIARFWLSLEHDEIWMCEFEDGAHATRSNTTTPPN